MSVSIAVAQPIRCKMQRLSRKMWQFACSPRAIPLLAAVAGIVFVSSLIQSSWDSLIRVERSSGAPMEKERDVDPITKAKENARKYGGKF